MRRWRRWRYDAAGQGVARQAWRGKAWRGPARHGSAGRGRHGLAGPGKAWRGSAGKARHGAARQGGARLGLAGKARLALYNPKTPVKIENEAEANCQRAMKAALVMMTETMKSEPDISNTSLAAFIARPRFEPQGFAKYLRLFSCAHAAAWPFPKDLSSHFRRAASPLIIPTSGKLYRLRGTR